MVRLDGLGKKREVVVERGDDQGLFHLQVGRRRVVADAIDVLMSRTQRVRRDLMHRLGNGGREQQCLTLDGQIG